MVATLLPAEALAHPRRAIIHASIQSDPGMGFRELQARVGIPTGTLRFHLSVLGRSGLVREERVGGALALMPGDDHRRGAVVAILREPGMVELRDVIQRSGRLCQQTIFTAMGPTSRSTVQHRLGRLVHAGVLRATWQGRYRFYEVAA